MQRPGTNGVESPRGEDLIHTSGDVEARRYRIVSVLGKGGFGKVYRAVLEGPGGFHKDVAIKLLRDEDAPESTIRRFRDQVKILGLVRDRAIVTVEPPTRLGGRWAVVMEYVDGASLQRLMSMGPMPASAAAEVVQEIARVLDKVYRMPGPDGEPLRILHRDIKPGNVQVTPDGEIKVLDFGIARADHLDSRSAASSAREAQASAYGSGTMGFVAPERLEGVDTPAGDVFSLGVTLHFMITGERPTRREGVDLDDPATQHMGPEALAMVQLSGRMRSTDPHERPTAREVEEACARIRRKSDGVSLRDWAEKQVPRAVALKFSDEMVGSVLTETPSGALVGPRPGARDPDRSWASGSVDPLDEETADFLSSETMHDPSSHRAPPRSPAQRPADAGRSRSGEAGRSRSPESTGRSRTVEAGRSSGSRSPEDPVRSATARSAPDRVSPGPPTDPARASFVRAPRSVPPEPARSAPSKPELDRSFGAAPKLSDEPTLDLDESGILRAEDLELVETAPHPRGSGPSSRPADPDRSSTSRSPASPKSLAPGRSGDADRSSDLDRPSGSTARAASPKSLAPGRSGEADRSFDLDRPSGSTARSPASPKSLAPGRSGEADRSSDDLDRSSGSRPAVSAKSLAPDLSTGSRPTDETRVLDRAPKSMAPGRPGEADRASDLDRSSGSRPAVSAKSLAPDLSTGTRPTDETRVLDRAPKSMAPGRTGELELSSTSRPTDETRVLDRAPKSMAPGRTGEIARADLSASARPSDDTRVLERSPKSMAPGRPNEGERSGVHRAPSLRPLPVPEPLEPSEPEHEERSTASWIGLAMMGTFVGGGLGGVTVLVLVGLFFLGSELLEPAPPPVPLAIGPSTSLPALSIDPLPLPGELVTPEVAPGFELPEEETDTPAPKKTARTKPPPEPEEPPLPAVAGAKTRDITFSSVPLGTDVYVDGVKIGQTPLIGVKVPEGRHEVKLISDAETLIRKIDVGRKKPDRYVWKGGDLWELHY